MNFQNLNFISTNFFKASKTLKLNKKGLIDLPIKALNLKPLAFPFFFFFFPTLF